MTIRNGAVYDGLYARAAACFLGTMAPVPADDNRAAAHGLIRHIYEAVASDAAALGWKPMPDMHFEPWEQQKGREKDVRAIRDAIGKIDALMRTLLDAVNASNARADGLTLPADYPAFKKSLTKALALAGCVAEPGLLRMPRGCAEGLKELCEITRGDKQALLFSRGVFDPSGDWEARAFDALLGADGQLIALTQALEARGYARVDCRDGKKVGLDYGKPAPSADEPLKDAWAERDHRGIAVSFEELRAEPCFLWLRMPAYKTVLARADKLPASVRDFLAAHTKTCDGCRYCVQTDKTGARPLAAVAIAGVAKCPLYPGFTMNWRALSPALAEDILAALDALEEISCESH